MNHGDLWLALIVGLVLGALAALVWRARREQALRIETELLRARLKTEETLSAEREQAAARTQEQLHGVFGELARDSLRSNSEVFLQLARERLARQQLDASQVLKERETAIESLVKPIREALAKTEAQIQAIERERIDSFATIKTQMDGLALGPERAVARDAQFGHRIAPPRRPRPMGRDYIAAGGRTVRHDAARGFHRTATCEHGIRRDSPGHGGPHA